MPPRRTLFVFSQHQLASIAATGVDYCVMILCVSVLGLSPVLGTALGALFGAVTSFTLGRNWVFDAREGDLKLQALRYAAISAVSLGCNAGGEALVVWLGANYVIGRVAVSVVVGMVWNYPMHRYFVFRMAPRGELEGPAAPADHEPAARALSDADAARRTARHPTSS